MTTRPPASLFKPVELPDGSMGPPPIAPALRPLVRHVSDVSPYPGNARNGDTDLIGQSLDAHGQYAPVVMQSSSGHLVKGNHVYHAILERGQEWIAVTELDVDDDRARRIVLVDNFSSDAGRYDDPLLAALLEPYALAGDWTGIGTDEHGYQDLLDRMERNASRDLELAGGMESTRGLGTPVISYAIVFDDAEQQSAWYDLMRWMRTTYDSETLGARIHTLVSDLQNRGIIDTTGDPA